MKKLLFLLLLAMMLPMMASAQELVDGIYYKFNSNDKTCVVTVNPNQYSGEITIPQAVKRADGLTYKVNGIDANAFQFNKEVTDIHMPITISEIGENAFAGCEGITSIEIPKNVYYIRSGAFSYLKKVIIYCYAEYPSLGDNVFYKTKSFVLNVPYMKLDYFKKADQWKKAKDVLPSTRESWAVEAQKEYEAKRLAEEQAKARQKAINDSIEARQKYTNDSLDAIQGNVDAQIRMAKRYENGDGVEKDINKALDYYRQLGDQGNAEAQLHLGDVYSKGLGVDKDEKEAMEWYRKAAEAGNADGQYNLGSCYYYGIGTAKDIKTGMEWTNKAATQGHELAKARQEVYEEEYGSYWKSQDDWRIVFPNGQIVGHNKGEVRSILFTKDFIAQFIDWDDWDDFDSFNKVKEGKKLRPMNKSLQMIPLDMSSFEALSIQDKTKILKENIEIFILDGINVSVLNRKGDYGDLVGIYDKGKFVSAESIKAAEEKALNAKLASFTKRFGFNPDGKGAKQLIAYGRSLSLLTEWYYFRRDHQCSYYFFNLHQDLGSQKRYGIYYAKDYYSNSGKRQGYIWVKGDRITSVEWNR